jgi:SRSO17 transposase
MASDRMAKEASEPPKYWLSTLPAKTALKPLVKLAKHRWIIERDYEELKQELGLGHYERRGWRGFHHHATLCIAAYGFLVSERSRFPPQHVSDMLDYAPANHHKASGRAAHRVVPSGIIRLRSRH